MPSQSKSKVQPPTFELTAKQAELVAAATSLARHVLAYGGSRSGKTFGFCYCIANRALMAPGSRHLIARLHNIDVRQSVMLDTWPKMMRLAFPDVPFEANKTDQYAILPTGSEVWFRDGKYLSEVPGSLWSLGDRSADDGRTMPGIDTLRRAAYPTLQRVVVGVDPSGSDGTTGDAQGIIVSGKGVDGHAYVLADRSCRLSPDGWARAVAAAADEFGADRIVAERNFGGAMVEAVLRTAAPNMPVKLVTASRGKVVRAEPVAALYEQGTVHHVGTFADLEDQMTMTTTAGFQGGGSPDRMDALVWCLTELMETRQMFDMRKLL